MRELIKVEISVTEGELTTTSLEVARVFEKEHKDVLKAIKNLDCSEEFAERNFALGEYLDKNGQARPSYTLTKTGFSFLAFGFTGEKAGQYREAYINEFERMEKALRGVQPAIHTSPTLEASSVFRAYHDVAMLFELKGNQALLSANKATLKQTGVSFMESLEITHLTAPVQQQEYIPTEIGKMLESHKSAIEVNSLLEDLGLQESYQSFKKTSSAKPLPSGGGSAALKLASASGEY